MSKTTLVSKSDIVPVESGPFKGYHPFSHELNSQLLYALDKHFSRLQGKLFTFIEALGDNESIIKARKDMIRSVLNEYSQNMWAEFSSIGFGKSMRTIVREVNEWINREVIRKGGGDQSLSDNPYSYIDL